jgi:hypothetical protein
MFFLPVNGIPDLQAAVLVPVLEQAAEPLQIGVCLLHETETEEGVDGEGWVPAPFKSSGREKEAAATTAPVGAKVRSYDDRETSALSHALRPSPWIEVEKVWVARKGGP